MQACTGRWWWTGILFLLSGGPLAAWALEAQPVTFAAGDGLRIHAAYYPPPLTQRDPAPIVILLHGLHESRAAWEPLLAPLHEAGFAILAPDLRGHGESATTATREAVQANEAAVFRAMQHDLRGAYDWLAASPHHDRARFALVGTGLGVSVALQYTAADRSVDTVVGLSPLLAAHGLDPAGDIAQITGRRLLLVGTDEDRDAMYSLKARGEGIETRAQRGARERGVGLFTDDADLARTLASELKTAVGTPAREPVYGSIQSHVYHQPDSGWLAQIGPSNLRHYSSAEEAQRRGLRAAKSGGPRQRGTASPTRDGPAPRP